MRAQKAYRTVFVGSEILLTNNSVPLTSMGEYYKKLTLNLHSIYYIRDNIYTAPNDFGYLHIHYSFDISNKFLFLMF